MWRLAGWLQVCSEDLKMSALPVDHTKFLGSSEDEAILTSTCSARSWEEPEVMRSPAVQDIAGTTGSWLA